MENKGLILGMFGLGLGSALVGGVGGFLLAPQAESAQSIVDESREEFKLPDEFAHVSFNRYSSSKYDFFTSSTLNATYTLDVEKNDFKLLYNSSLTGFYDAGDKIFLRYSDGRFGCLDSDREFTSVKALEKYSFLTIFGSDSSNLYLRVALNNVYSLCVLNLETLESDVFDLNGVSSVDLGAGCVIGDYYCFSSVGNSSTKVLHFVNKETKDVNTVSQAGFLDITQFVVKDNSLYSVFAKSSSSYVLGKIDLGTFELTSLKTYSGSQTSLKLRETELGMFVYCGAYNIDYLSFEDDSVTSITTASSFGSFELGGKQYFSASKTENPSISVFDEETKTLVDVYVYDLTNSSNSSLYFTLANFEGHNILELCKGSSSGYVAFNATVVDGELKLEQILLKRSISGDVFKVSKDAYIWSGSGVEYYDFESDTYLNLVANSTIVELTQEGDVVTLYASDNVKYEFNVKTLSIKAVAYWE
ncbi:MAG: hypothetical protein J6K39_02845 [Clostridia bacterium]|nr:hypothetical protein [Clostridia bacterium]